MPPKGRGKGVTGEKRKASDQGESRQRPPPSRSAKQSKQVRALQEAISNLSIGGTQELVGREVEVNMIAEFLRESDGHPTLQLFGLPGTGKTAAVRSALAMLEEEGTAMTVAFLNGYVVQRPAEIYAVLYRKLSQDRLGKEENLSAEQAQAQLEVRMKKGWGNRASATRPCVIVVDEVDRCHDRSGKTLFKLVDWMSSPHAKCKLITIANRMHLPESLDGKTRSRLNTTQRVTFDCYTADQLAKIIQNRVAGIQPPVFSESALNYLCNLVAAANGDTRRLLQAASTALHQQLVELDGEDDDDEAKQAAKKAMATKTGPLVEIADMRSTIRNIFHDPFADFVNAIRGPLVFLTVATCALETRQRDAVFASPRLDILHLHIQTRTAVEKFRNVLGLPELYNTNLPKNVGAGTNEVFTLTTFLDILDMLRQVNLVSLSCGPEDTVQNLTDTTAVQYCNETVYVTLQQPSDVVIATLETHDRWKLVAGKIFRETG